MKPVAYIGAIAAAVAIGIAGSGGGQLLSLSPGSLPFGSQDILSGATASQQVQLQNTGHPTVHLSSVTITGADAADFTLSNPCGNAIGGGSSCPVSISFDPSTAGAKSAALTVSDDSSGSPHSTALSGTGTSGGGGGGPTLFVGQSLAGTGDGSSCSNEKDAAFFNTAGNWGVGHPFAPNTTIGICGTITSTLTAQGSGTAGSPITLLFQPNAKISQPVCGSCLNLSGRSFIIVDGGVNGVVESNANGTALANHSNSTGINANPCNSCEIKNLTIQNIYAIGPGDSFICSSGCAVDNTGARCVQFSGANWKIHDNVMHDASWCLFESGNGTDANNRIYNNNIYNIDHGWTITGSGPFGSLYFYGNHIHDMAVYDNCSGCHHDGIHCFGGNGFTFTGPNYIYDNRWDGALGSSATGWVYLESNAGSACSADPATKWYLFNNVFSSTDQVSTNAYVGSTTGTIDSSTYLYNNTFDGPGFGRYGANNAGCVDPKVDLENNAIGGCAQLTGVATGVQDHNAYAETTGGNCWPGAGCTFSTWQGLGHDTNGVFDASTAAGQNVLSVGANLTSLCVGELSALCSDINGVARPSSGAWDAGAVQMGGPPVLASLTGAYLVRGSQPFLIRGDSAGSMINASTADADTYFADRQSRGFNAVLIHALCGSGTGCPANGQTFDGIAPFTSGTSPGNYDLSTPNSAFWSRMDTFVNDANAHGLVVLLDPTDESSYLAGFTANGSTKVFNFGVFVGNRYKNKDVIWWIGNDFQTYSSSTDSNLIKQEMDGIASVDPTHLMTAQLNYFFSTSLDDAIFAPRLTLNGVYSYAPTYDQTLHALAQSATMPIFYQEGNFENAVTSGISELGTPKVMRRQEWWTVLSSALGGYMYGEHLVHHFTAGWQAQLGDPGAVQTGYEAKFLSLLPWYKLVPDSGHTTLTAGFGTYGTATGNESSSDYATAARASDGSFVAVYAPTIRAMTIDMSKLSSTVTARWFDPTNGTYATVAGSPFANSGTHVFTPTGNNAAGETDWVLLLQGG